MKAQLNKVRGKEVKYMREFFEDVKYMCSSSNTKSRGFYLAVTIASILFLLVSIAAIVLVVVGVIKTNIVQVIIASVVAIALVVGVWVFLAKQ